MARVVLIGHGGYIPQAGGYPGEILVPPGTTLKFYAEAGEALKLPLKDGPGGKRVLDHEKFQGPWDHLQDEGSPLGERQVTYNFQLQPERSDAEVEAMGQIDWGGQMLTPPLGGDAYFLCKGSEDTCPTPALLVQQRKHDAGEEGEDGSPVPAVADDRWSHRCDGILGIYAGNELHWVACSSIVLDDATKSEMPVTMTAQTGLGTADDREHGELLGDTRLLNADALSSATPGTPIPIAVGGGVFLIGSRHLAQAADFLRQVQEAQGIGEGQLTVAGGGAITITGISESGHQELIRMELAEIAAGRAVTFA